MVVIIDIYVIILIIILLHVTLQNWDVTLNDTYNGVTEVGYLPVLLPHVAD